MVTLSYIVIVWSSPTAGQTEVVLCSILHTVAPHSEELRSVELMIDNKSTNKSTNFLLVFVCTYFGMRI